MSMNPAPEVHLVSVPFVPSAESVGGFGGSWGWMDDSVECRIAVSGESDPWFGGSFGASCFLDGLVSLAEVGFGLSIFVIRDGEFGFSRGVLKSWSLAKAIASTMDGL
jgi:hypothetical protein